LDRCALFVDAGYVLAEGALAVHGTRNRDSVSWDYAGLLKLLGGLSRDRTGLPLLRCYWYDTAAEGGRATEHDTLADVPGVKLRLSKVRPSRKEGVEAEIRKDLSALARNRAVSDAVIVSAEEDLAPVIAEIQDLGIRVVLLHISTDGNWAISRSLRQECDDIIDMSAAHLRPFVDLITGAEPAGRDSQLTVSGYRELSASPAAASQLQGAGQPAIAAAAPQLYSSPVAPDYERVSQAQLATAREQQTGLAAQDASRFPAGPGPAGPGADSGSSQRRHEDQPQLVSQHYQGQDPGRGLAPGAGVPAAQGGYGQSGFGSDQVQPGNGQGRASNGTAGQSGLGQIAGPQPGGSGAHGLLPGSMPAAQSPQSALTQNGLPQNGLPQNGLQQGGPPQNGLQQNGLPHSGPPGSMAPAPVPQNGLPHGGYGQAGGQQANGQPGGPAPAGMQLGTGLLPGQDAHQPAPNGMSGHGQQSAGPQPGTAVPPGSGVQPGQAPQLGQGTQPGQGLPPGQDLSLGQGPSQHGLPSQGTHPGLPQPGPSAQPGQPHGLPGQGAQGQAVHGQPLPGGQGMPAGMGMPPGQPQGSHRQGAGPQQPGGLAPLDPQRGLAPPRPIPAVNGIPYPPPDRSGQYGGQPGQLGGQPAQFGGQPGQPAQFSAPPPGGGYGQPPYSGPQPSMPVPQPPPPVTISVGEAVQSAHAEGFGFGEAVARDAPALWLEAVLARKPRMPSDLEARLLQGSALPIDSLLHDEVRHALRRGFWDALERSRH
jgi:hypothetical protein